MSFVFRETWSTEASHDYFLRTLMSASAWLTEHESRAPLEVPTKPRGVKGSTVSQVA
jgi:hypothetical protein